MLCGQLRLSMEMVGRSQVWVEQLKLPRILVDSVPLLAMLGIEPKAVGAIDRLSSELRSQPSWICLNCLPLIPQPGVKT